MSRGLLFSFLFHALVIFMTALTLPFMMREPIDLPPIVSVELIEIKDKTFIPFAPKARKIIEKVKEENKRVVSEQAPPSAKAKEKPNIPTNGPIPPIVADSTNNVPTIGPVQEKETKAKVKAIKNIPKKPPLLEAESAFVTHELGKLISKAPKNEMANTTRRKKKNILK